MDRREFFRNLVRWPFRKIRPKGTLIINNDVDIKGTIRVISPNGHAAFTVEPMDPPSWPRQMPLVATSYPPIQGPTGSTGPFEEPYRLTVGDKAHG